MLLFFLYNYINDVILIKKLSTNEKLLYIESILNDGYIIKLFKKIKISKLLISPKQKIITYMYKYKIGVKLLVRRFGG